MSSLADATADQAHEMMKDAADHWGLIAVMGVLSIIPPPEETAAPDPTGPRAILSRGADRRP